MCLMVYKCMELKRGKKIIQPQLDWPTNDKIKCVYSRLEILQERRRLMILGLAICCPKVRKYDILKANYSLFWLIKAHWMIPFCLVEIPKCLIDGDSGHGLLVNAIEASPHPALKLKYCSS